MKQLTIKTKNIFHSLQNERCIINKILIALLVIYSSSCSNQNNTIKEYSDTIKKDTTQNSSNLIERAAVESITIQVQKGKLYFIKRNDSIFLNTKFSNENIFKLVTYADSENNESVEEFKIIDYNSNKFFLVNISTNGSAGENYDHLYCIDTIQGILQQVEIKYAINAYKETLPKDLSIPKDELRDYYSDSIIGVFRIGKSDDPGCCPTVGDVKAYYNIYNLEGKWVMSADSMVFAHANE